MGKLLRYLAFTLVGVLLLGILVVAIALYTIDPNDYKADIEKLVEDNSRLDLKLDGQIEWSLIPLGLELNHVSADLEGQPLIKLDQLLAKVDFWSLLRMQPAVDTFSLKGLTANLNKNQQGEGNWERIALPASEPAAPAKTDKTDKAGTTSPADTVATAEATKQPMHFKVSQIEIVDANISYSDAQTGQTIKLTPFSLTASDIAPGKDFPLDIRFALSTSQPQMTIDGSLSGQINASESFQQFALNGLDGRFALQGAPFNGKQLDATIGGSLSADLEQHKASLSDLIVNLANVTMMAQLQVDGWQDKPRLQGELALKAFSLQQLLAELGQAPIVTADDKVLQKVALSTKLGGPAGQLALTDLLLTLDDTQLKGQAGYTLDNGFIQLKLQGDKLNADRYLPPQAPSDTAAVKAQVKATQAVLKSDTATAADKAAALKKLAQVRSATASAGTASTNTANTNTTDPTAAAPAVVARESDLLPLKTLRDLGIDATLGLDQLIVSKLTISDLKTAFDARNGLINLKTLSGKMYEGDFNASASIDARSDKPAWKIKKTINHIQTLPLMKDFAELEVISGAINLTADITTQGNRISALRNNASGAVNLNIDKGAFIGENLSAHACEGIARINGEDIKTGNWPKQTDFDELSAAMTIKGNSLNNTSLRTQLSGMLLEGNGTIDLASMALDYQAGLKVVGVVNQDPACRVSEKVQGLVLPIKCEGVIGAGGSLCGLDQARLGSLLQSVAVNTAKEKINKKLDKKLDKLFGDKAPKDTSNMTEEEKQKAAEKDAQKDAVKDLFKKLF